MSSEPTSSEYEEQRMGHGIMSELRLQRGISLPLTVMNLTWFVKITITTAFLGRLGELELAGGVLGFTFANVTGFSVLTGLCAAMEPICGQAFGAKNFKLLHKTLVMAIFMLLTASVPVSLLWLYIDDILIYFGQQKDISVAAKNYLMYLLPDLVVTSFLCPLKTYLSSQNITVPVMFSSGVGLALHVPVNILLVRAKGFTGVAMAVWVTDLIVTALLGFYVMVVEKTKEEKGGWLDQDISDWSRVLKLAGPCCLTTCLEWWCYEILILLTGRLADAKRAVGVLAIVINFDYLLYSVMLSLATCASIRVSNELGGNHAKIALRASRVSLSMSVLLGFAGAVVMVAARGSWGPLFSRDSKIIRGVEKMMLLMALVEVVNFPLAVCGGILRGTARPWLAMYANLGGFYAVALPLGVFFAFRIGFGLGGLLVGFLIGMATCLLLMLVFVTRIDWDEEAKKALMRASNEHAEMCVSDSQP